MFPHQHVPHCIDYNFLVKKDDRSEKEEKKLQKLQDHQMMYPVQRKAYLEKKKWSNDTDGACILVMDFAKIDVYHYSFQILHMIYYINNSQRILKSYIGHNAEKNDVYMVIDVFLKYVVHIIAEFDINHLIIFTDGGPKHFKCTQFLSFLWKLNQAYETLKIEYNFFASYHGCNGCDGAAAQASQKVKRYINDTGVYPRNADELKIILDNLSGHDYTLLDKVLRNNDKSPVNLIKVKTLKGIRTFHQFTFANEPFSYVAKKTSDPLCLDTQSMTSVPSVFPELIFPLTRLFEKEKK